AGFRSIRRPETTTGGCVRIRTNPIRRRGADRTSMTFTRKTRARDSMAPSIATGIKARRSLTLAPRTISLRLLRGRCDGGFTLIEVMVVMALIVLLASIGLTQYRNGITRSEEAVLREDLFRLREALDQYYADKNKWPADLSELVS